MSAPTETRVGPGTGDETLRVLHLGKYFPPHPGGMETFLRDLLWASLRDRVAVAALVHQSRPGQASARETCRGSAGSFPLLRAGLWFRMLYTPVSPAFPWLLGRLLREFTPHVIHVHMPSPSAFWLLLSPRARKLPWVLHWQADPVDASAGAITRLVYRWCYRPLQDALLRRCRAVIVTSPAYLESSEPLQRYREKCTVIPLGLDPQTLHAAPRKPAETGGGFRLLAVGRLAYYKALDTLLLALQSLPDVRLAIVGEGEEGKRLRQMARQLGVDQRVEFLGSLDSKALALEYRRCDCLCLPSSERSEAFGLVLLEAMSFARAVIASDIPGSGVGWVVQDGVNGIKVAPRAVDQWVSAITRLDDDRDLCRRLGEAGRDMFEARYHIDRCAGSVHELYRRVLQA